MASCVPCVKTGAEVEVSWNSPVKTRAVSHRAVDFVEPHMDQEQR